MSPTETLLAFYRIFFGGLIVFGVFALGVVVYGTRQAIQLNREREKFRRDVTGTGTGSVKPPVKLSIVSDRTKG